MFNIVKMPLALIIVADLWFLPFEALSGDLKSLTLESDDIQCVSCALTIKRQIGKIQGVAAVEVSARTKRIHVKYDGTTLSDKEIMRKLTALGYRAKAVLSP